MRHTVDLSVVVEYATYDTDSKEAIEKQITDAMECTLEGAVIHSLKTTWHSSDPEVRDRLQVPGTVWELNGQSWQTLKPTTDFDPHWAMPWIVAVRIGNTPYRYLVDTWSLLGLTDRENEITFPVTPMTNHGGALPI